MADDTAATPAPDLLAHGVETLSSVTVHAYSPPLWRMGQYAVSESGVLRRVSVSYADELRPID